MAEYFGTRMTIKVVLTDNVSNQKRRDRLANPDPEKSKMKLKNLVKQMEIQGLRTFADQMQDAIFFFKKYPKQIPKFQHILVDEYQDVNEVQHRLLQWLAGARAQVMVVGDVDQCIYTWRGANPEFLGQRFVADFVGATTYHLPHTFRFGHRLALLANYAIAQNPWADRHPVLSASTCVDTQVVYSVGEDGGQMIEPLLAWRMQGGRWQDCAVLVRLWAQAGLVELRLLQANIPYRLLGDRSIWDSIAAQGMMAILSVASGDIWQQTYEVRHRLLTAFWQCPNMGLSLSARERLVSLSAQSPEAVYDAIEALPTDRAWLKPIGCDVGMCGRRCVIRQG
jgi:DNA helicase-2/ATP-dependent DNA helicase PcrA